MAWSTDKKYGEKAEQEAKEYILKQFGAVVKEIRLIEYKHDPQKQLNGIDLEVVLCTGQVINVDVKSRRKFTNDLCIEVFWSEEVKDWAIKTNSTDFLLFLIPGREAIWVDKFFLLQLWSENEHWREYIIKNRINSQRCAYIPISEFSQEYLGKSGLAC